MFDFHLRLNITKGKVKELNLKKAILDWPLVDSEKTNKQKNSISHPPLRGKPPDPERLASASLVYTGAAHEPFCQSKRRGFGCEWRRGRRSTGIKVEKERERKEGTGLNPPSLQSPPLQRCLVIFIYWDDFARNPVAWRCPPTLWYVACFLAGCPPRKRGSGGQPGRPPQEKHT